MDKMQNPLSTPQTHRGFALMITLSVLSVVIALTIVLLSYFTEVKEDAKNTEALIQANIYYADIVEQFNKTANKKSLLSKLYTQRITFKDKKTYYTLTLGCDSLDRGVNINWLALDHNKKKQHLYQVSQSLFDTLSENYDIEDPDRLLEMLLHEISIGSKFVKQEQSRLIQKNGIISYEQFSKIIKQYELEIDDTKIKNVPWQKYFSFSSQTDKIDIKRSSSELISFLFDIDLSLVNEWKISKPKPTLQKFVNENAGNYNEKKSLFPGKTFLGKAICSVTFDTKYKFTFEYIDGEAKYFEFYGKK
jgi:hypothetical protein